MQFPQLPEKLSGLLRLAIEDGRRADRGSFYPASNVWLSSSYHMKKEYPGKMGECIGCLSGAVMLESLDLYFPGCNFTVAPGAIHTGEPDGWLSHYGEKLQEAWGHALSAIAFFVDGDFVSTWDSWCDAVISSGREVMGEATPWWAYKSNDEDSPFYRPLSFGEFAGWASFLSELRRLETHVEALEKEGF